MSDTVIVHIYVHICSGYQAIKDWYPSLKSEIWLSAPHYGERIPVLCLIQIHFLYILIFKFVGFFFFFSNLLCNMKSASYSCITFWAQLGFGLHWGCSRPCQHISASWTFYPRHRQLTCLKAITVLSIQWCIFPRSWKWRYKRHLHNNLWVLMYGCKFLWG